MRYLFFLFQYNLKRIGLPFVIEDSDQHILHTNEHVYHFWDENNGLARYRTKDLECDLVIIYNNTPDIQVLWQKLNMSDTQCEVPDMLDPCLEDLDDVREL